MGLVLQVVCNGLTRILDLGPPILGDCRVFFPLRVQVPIVRYLPRTTSTNTETIATPYFGNFRPFLGCKKPTVGNIYIL